MSESKNNLWKRLKKQTLLKKNEEKETVKAPEQEQKIEDIYQEVVNSKAFNSGKAAALTTENLDPETEDFVKELSSAFENVEEVDVSCVS